MFKVPVYWFTSDGNEQRYTVFLHSLPQAGERIDLSAIQSEVAEYCPAEAKHLECFRVLAVEHCAVPFNEDTSPDPGLVVLLERDPEVQHQMELEEQRELTDSVRRSFTRLLRVLNDLAGEELHGTFGMVSKEEGSPGLDEEWIVFKSHQLEVARAAVALADIVYVPLPDAVLGRYRCVKHRTKNVPFETTWTGV